LAGSFGCRKNEGIFSHYVVQLSTALLFGISLGLNKSHLLFHHLRIFVISKPETLFRYIIYNLLFTTFFLSRANFEKIHSSFIWGYSKTEVTRYQYKEKTTAWANFNVEIRRVVLEDKRRQTYMVFRTCFQLEYDCPQRIKMILLYPSHILFVYSVGNQTWNKIWNMYSTHNHGSISARNISCTNSVHQTISWLINSLACNLNPIIFSIIMYTNSVHGTDNNTRFQEEPNSTIW
jgi:hypothetical protein